MHKIMRDAAANTCTTRTHRPRTNCAPLADPPSLDAMAVTTAPAQKSQRHAKENAAHKEVQCSARAAAGACAAPATATAMPQRRTRVRGSVFRSVTMMVAGDVREVTGVPVCGRR